LIYYYGNDGELFVRSKYGHDAEASTIQ